MFAAALCDLPPSRAFAIAGIRRPLQNKSGVRAGPASSPDPAACNPAPLLPVMLLRLLVRLLLALLLSLLLVVLLLCIALPAKTNPDKTNCQRVAG